MDKQIIVYEPNEQMKMKVKTDAIRRSSRIHRGDPLVTMNKLLSLLICAAAPFAIAEARVVTWPAAEGTAVTNDFALSVNGKSVDVIGISARWDGESEERPDDPMLNYSAAFFDADETVEVKVTSKRDLSNVRILPLSLGLQPKHVDAHTITFAAKPPFKISVEPNGRERALIVKALIPEVNPPKEGDRDVVYIGPGRHRKPNLELKSGQTLYLAPGAWMEGSVHGTGTNITVRGRGIISGNPWPWNKGPGRMLVLSGMNVRVNGITLIGSWGWTVLLKDVHGAQLSDLAILGGRCLNDDGIDVFNSHDVTVRDSFVRAQDDCIAPKHCVSNLVVEDCQLWVDTANAIRIGHENSYGFGMRDLVFRNIDVLHQSRVKTSFDETWPHCAVNMECSNDKHYSNVLFENFRIDTPETGDNLAMLVVRPIRNSWFDYKTAGNIRDVTFRNLTVNGDIPAGSETVLLWDYDANHTVKDVRFENVDSRVKVNRKGD